ncbi:gas vesicle protein K [Streptomyces sp. NPDC051907]|uniref:gas vesicle protein K n=1 Tax=Streptomyces sp. NPDC051907 TaxID=3155284 RepID=UPI003424D929
MSTWCTSTFGRSSGPSPPMSRPPGETPHPTRPLRCSRAGSEEVPVPSASAPPSTSNAIAQRLETDPESVERDLMKLVLTIVELLRQLMERTALHRVDQGDLGEDQEERIGMTLMILQERMTELCERYDLTMDDLNLDLGPLGSLLPQPQ